MRDRPDDVLGPKRGVTTEKYLGQACLHGRFVYHRHIPFIKINSRIPFNPGERILLADGNQHVVAGHMHIGLARGDQSAASLVIVFRFDDFEAHAGEFAVLKGERLGYMKIDDGNTLVLGILFFPRRGFHFFKARPHNDFDVVTAQPPRGTAAVHGRIATAQYDHALADFFDVSERDRR